MKVLAFLALLLLSHTSNSATLCVGELTGSLCKPKSPLIDANETVTAPVGLFVSDLSDRYVMRVSLPLPYSFAGFDTDGDVLLDTASVIAVGSQAGAASVSLSGIRVGGVFGFVEDITVTVEVFSPNTGDTLPTRQVVIAATKGVADGTLLFVNPASNTAQQSFIRLATTDYHDVDVLLLPRDDAGATGGSILVHLPAGTAMQINATALENGDDRFIGAFGKGTGKWRVRVAANAPLFAHAYVRTPDGGVSDVGGMVP